MLENLPSSDDITGKAEVVSLKSPGHLYRWQSHSHAEVDWFGSVDVLLC